MLLYKMERKEDIRSILIELIGQITDGIGFSNTFPLISNSVREIVELEVDHQRRIKHFYSSSIFFTVIIEWTVVIQNANLYNNLREVRKRLLPELELMLWFPDGKTEEMLFTGNATHESGYCLSGIDLVPDFDEFTAITKTEFEYNCKEKEFAFIKTPFWVLGLVASRHHRTYPFPYYWRCRLPRFSPIQKYSSG